MEKIIVRGKIFYKGRDVFMCSEEEFNDLKVGDVIKNTNRDWFKVIEKTDNEVTIDVRYPSYSTIKSYGVKPRVLSKEYIMDNFKK